MPLLRFVDAISVLKARPERFGSTSRIACRRKLLQIQENGAI
jgi:hypothetical protein